MIIDEGSCGKISELINEVLIPIYSLPNIRLALSASAAIFYDTLGKDVSLAAVTGTNGKTSVAWIISQLFSMKFGQSFYMGTLGSVEFHKDSFTQIEDDGRTGTDPVSFHRLIRKFTDAGIKRGAIEITSHGIDQSRAEYLDLSTAIFTNLTQDHLDYHGTMENYGATKLKLFTEALLKSKRSSKSAIINADDEFGKTILEKLYNINGIDVIGISKVPGQRVRILSHSSEGVCDSIVFEFDKVKYSYKSNLLGSFNVYNTLSAILVGLNFDISIKESCELFSEVKNVPGRLELVEKVLPRVFVDYAHTPDALEKVNAVVRKMVDSEGKGGRLITLFGCGGDRDRKKRPLMGAAVSGIADVSILTSDNPRSEDPNAILADVVPGVDQVKSKLIVEVDRFVAIRKAIEIANENDIVVIAGKGHEPYQEVKGAMHPFDDRVEARKVMKDIGMIKN